MLSLAVLVGRCRNLTVSLVERLVDVVLVGDEEAAVDVVRDWREGNRIADGVLLCFFGRFRRAPARFMRVRNVSFHGYSDQPAATPTQENRVGASILLPYRLIADWKV